VEASDVTRQSNQSELGGRVAVVTGAASGIGLGLAAKAAALGMQVVMADIEKVALDEAAAEVSGLGTKVLPITTDVSDTASVEQLAAAAEAAFGPVWLLCNNAGVAGGGLTWEISPSTWQWVLGVNMWGVIHGIAAFLPGMVERGEGHVVNTASMAGLLASPGMAPYTASKHAVVGISETLYRDLELMGSGVGVSVLCPGFVNTRIGEADRNWPSRLGPPPVAQDTPMAEMVREALQARLAGGTPPSEVADEVFDAVADRRFWILPHADEYAAYVRARFDNSVEGRNPEPFQFQ
jgi:NAD(P)-dependent dehydrogenase (short-subunit alcohol dehydrogenase family)